MDSITYSAIKTFWDLKENNFYPFSEEIIQQAPFHKDEILTQRDELNRVNFIISNLSSDDIKVCKNNLLESVTKAKELLSIDYNYKLSRNQGLIIPNHIYAKIIRIIESSMTGVIGYGYSDFYTSTSSSFEPKPIIESLQKNLEVISKHNFETYVELIHAYENIKNELLEFWKKDDELFPNGED